MSPIKRLFSNVSDVDLAQSEVDSARGRLLATVEQIQQRISPSTLVDEALDQVKTRSEDIARSATAAVRKRPATAAATASGLTMMLLAKPLSAFFARRRTAREEPAPLSPRSARIRKPQKPAS